MKGPSLHPPSLPSPPPPPHRTTATDRRFDADHLVRMKTQKKHRQSTSLCSKYQSTICNRLEVRFMKHTGPLSILEPCPPSLLHKNSMKKMAPSCTACTHHTRRPSIPRSSNIHTCAMHDYQVPAMKTYMTDLPIRTYLPRG